MNPIKSLILIIAACLLFVVSNAQTTYEYTYDAAGNRILRQVEALRNANQPQQAYP
ncbi:MAG: hypothetical protein WCQ95_08245 [Bacteroidota bacterium]